MAIAATASGTLDWPRVAIAELAVLGNRAMTLERLKAARCTLPDAGQYAIGSLSMLPMEQPKSQQQKGQQQQQQIPPRACRTCGKKFSGPWSEEGCKAGHPKPAKGSKN